jgi:site-specific DNA recombinase
MKKKSKNSNHANQSENLLRHCAIYVRKSTTENLDTDFNSLDAQREACEAYIKSQQHEGWVALPDRYGDGGYSGGNMERPGLKKLITDIEAGKVQTVVVYKVDRLSRSLLDFSRIISSFDENGVSFVSVTQAFNTTNSMGRLTLNILLSFAQFERELISERTSDKMSAARRKGKWTGGIPMLGYDVASEGGKILVNESEAEQVRAIFKLYTEKQSLLDTARELNARGWRTKTWQTKKGKMHEGRRFNKINLYSMLSNVIYIGNINHKGTVYPGEHDAILDEKIFMRVNGLLKRNGSSGGKEARNKYGALLRGIIYCANCNCAMSHSYTARGAKRYRYYVCNHAQKEGWGTCPTKSLPASEIEKFVIERIKGIGQDEELLKATFEAARNQQRESIDSLSNETVRLETELRDCNANVNRLVGALGSEADPIITGKLAELQERIRTIELRLYDISAEKAALTRELVSEDELRTALGQFDLVWEALTPKERARILKLLIERVGYDGVENKVSITFRPSGIKIVATENEEAIEK